MRRLSELHALAVSLPIALAGCVGIPAPADQDLATDGSPGTLDASGSVPADAADLVPVGGSLECPGDPVDPFGSAFHIRKATDSYAKIDDSQHTGLDLSGSFTIEAWVAISEQFESANTYGIVTKDDYGSGSRGYTWYMDRPNSTTEVHARVAQPGNARGSEMVWSLASSDVGQWHHFALRFNIDQTTVADSLELFVDGVRLGGVLGNAEIDQEQISDSDAAFVIGAWPISGVGAQHFLGAIDDVRVWSYPRTAEEIATRRFTVLTGSEEGLVGYWPLDGDFLDKGPNENHLGPTNPDFCAGPQ